jgi:hypothetical protein
MYVRSLLLATALLALAGCAGNVTVPPPGLDHPANPQAAAAPSLPPLTIPEAREPTGAGMQGMQGMNHGSMKGMEKIKGISGKEDVKDKEGMEGMEGGYHAH